MSTVLLKLGSSGTKVMDLQRVLNHVVPEAPSLKVDGIFGAKTRDRVVAFQRKRALTADGVVGPVTGAALVVQILVPSQNQTHHSQGRRLR